MNTERSLLEIEVGLAKLPQFDFVKNIIAYNVQGIHSHLPIYHECDMLVLSKSGYLTEIEIKRSWSDFLADFKKKHNHNNFPIIKYFYFCVPESILEKVYNKLLEDEEFCYTGIITYDEDLNFNFHKKKIRINDTYQYVSCAMPGFRKLFLEEQLQVARYGAMRSVKLKEKLIDLNIKNVEFYGNNIK